MKHSENINYTAPLYLKNENKKTSVMNARKWSYYYKVHKCLIHITMKIQTAHEKKTEDLICGFVHPRRQTIPFNNAASGDRLVSPKSTPVVIYFPSKGELKAN